MFRDRTAAIQKAMQEAQKASEEARRRLAEIESRLMKLDVEIGTMRDAAEKEGAAEEARIQAAAEEDARKIVTAAEQEIAAAAKAARRQLTAYAADLAVGLARKQIHVDAATDQALVRKFAGQLGATSASDSRIRKGQELDVASVASTYARAFADVVLKRASRCESGPGRIAPIVVDCWPRAKICGECGKIRQCPPSRSASCWMRLCSARELSATSEIWWRC